MICAMICDKCKYNLLPEAPIQGHPYGRCSRDNALISLEHIMECEYFEAKKPHEINKGYYLIRLTGKTCDHSITMGYYDPKEHEDGSINEYPWVIMGDDRIFTNSEIEVVRKIEIGEIENENV